jgi:hypothetical protein
MSTIIKEAQSGIDREFMQDMRILSKAAKTNHPLINRCISHYIELYAKEKVNMELNKSIRKIFKV